MNSNKKREEKIYIGKHLYRLSLLYQVAHLPKVPNGPTLLCHGRRCISKKGKKYVNNGSNHS
jgi:hypothetical protein